MAVINSIPTVDILLKTESIYWSLTCNIFTKNKGINIEKNESNCVGPEKNNGTVLWPLLSQIFVWLIRRYVRFSETRLHERMYFTAHLQICALIHPINPVSVRMPNKAHNPK